jgi:hypothetical protein
MIRYSHLAILGLLLAGAFLVNAPAIAAEAQQPTQPAPAAAAEIPSVPEASLNPGLTYRGEVLTEDTVWRGEVLVEGALSIAQQATLTVEPGTVVYFRRRGAEAGALMVQGRIVATGTAERPVLFTSSLAAPAAGQWQGIILIGTEKKNLLENCRIMAAQTGIDALFSTVTLRNVQAERSGTGLRFQETLVEMERGGAAGCDTGVALSESEATLTAVSLAGNRVGLSGRKSSVYLLDGSLSGNQAAAFSGDSCSIKIQGGVFSGNGSGVTLLESEGGIAGARIAKNREFGMSLTASRIRVSGNTITANGNNGLMVFDGSAAAWDNAIYENAGYDLYNAGSEEFRAPGNWWGNGAAKVFDNGGRGKVLLTPVLKGAPVAPLQGS